MSISPAQVQLGHEDIDKVSGVDLAETNISDVGESSDVVQLVMLDNQDSNNGEDSESRSSDVQSAKKGDIKDHNIEQQEGSTNDIRKIINEPADKKISKPPDVIALPDVPHDTTTSDSIKAHCRKRPLPSKDSSNDINPKKAKPADTVAEQDDSAVVASIEETKEQLPIPNDNVKTLTAFAKFMQFRKLSSKLSRSDLEQFCIQKICECLMLRSTEGDLYKTIKKQQKSIEGMRKDVLQLFKQLKDLEIVNKRLIKDNEDNKPLVPLRIMRSVGLQVRLNPRNESPGQIRGNQPSNNPQQKQVVFNTALNKSELPPQPARQILPAPEKQAYIPVTSSPAGQILSQVIQQNNRKSPMPMVNSAMPIKLPDDSVPSTPGVIDLADRDEKLAANRSLLINSAIKFDPVSSPGHSIALNKIPSHKSIANQENLPIHYESARDQALADELKREDEEESHNVSASSNESTEDEYFPSISSCSNDSTMSCSSTENKTSDPNNVPSHLEETASTSTAESAINTNQNVSQNAIIYGKRRYQRHFCCYCEKLVNHFARHIRRNHISEVEVQKILSYPPRDPERQKLITLLRKKGNYINSVKKGQINDKLLPCRGCLGFYAKNQLWRHRKTCCRNTIPTRNCRADAQNCLLEGLEVDQDLKNKVFPRMRADMISLTAKMDPLICAFGARYLEDHRETGTFRFVINTASRKMREIARLLIEVKKNNPELNNLFKILQPGNFDIILQATKRIARYDPSKERFESPTYVSNIGTALKQCCDIAITYALKNKHIYPDVPTAEKEADLNKLIHIINENWKFEISNGAGGDVNMKKLDKMTITPSKCRKKGRISTNWTPEQKQVVTDFFKHHIKNKKPPRRAECEILKELHPEVLTNKDWLKIKVYIQNKYTGKCK